MQITPQSGQEYKLFASKFNIYAYLCYYKLDFI